MKYLDTSIVIDAMKPGSPFNLQCRNILTAIESGREQVIITPFILAELHFILEREGFLPDEIKRKLNAFLDLKGIHVVVYDPFLLKNSFELASKFKIDLIDATHKQLMDAFQIKEIYSLDKHFDRFEGIKRLAELKR